MSGVGKLYRVLRAGIRQRSSGGWKRPAVGELINVSDEMGRQLVAAGYAALASAPAAPTPGPPALPEGGVVGEAEFGLSDAQPAGKADTPGPARCPDHPRYQGRGEPHRGCAACARLHAESHGHEHEGAR